ncbi:hypothetical protein PFISCL1PPCAC_6347, partial [Pristionchus fissidentatus]
PLAVLITGSLSITRIEQVIESLPIPPQSNSTALDDTPRPYHDGKALHVPLNETASVDLMEHWLRQAFSGLLAAYASNKLDTVDEDVREELAVCSKDAHTVPAHARCVKKLIKASKESGERSGEVLVKDTAASHLKFKPEKIAKKITKDEDDEDVEWTGGFGQARAKRSVDGIKVVHRDSYSLRSHNEGQTPFSEVAKFLTKTVRAVKNKNENETWRETMLKVKKTAEEEREAKKSKDALKKKLRRMIDNTPEDFADPRRPAAMKKLEQEDEELETARKLVKEGKDEMRIPLNLMRDAIKLGMSLGGQNVSQFDKKTLKLVSPRFMSVVEDDAEDEDTINLLSPSLFSLHEDGKGLEALTSLPAILKKLKNNDQEAWMDFIIEASGVSDAVDKARKQRKESRDNEMRGSNGEPLYFTKQNVSDTLGHEEVRKVEVFETLDKTYTPEQKAELDSRGYLFMREDQIEILYGKDSVYHDEELYDRLMHMTKTYADHEKHDMLENDVNALAEMESFNLNRKPHSTRSKRNVIDAPVLFTPLVGKTALLSNAWIIRSPIVFSPIVLSPAALGPIILSPWVFVPLILSPRILSPLIVNPLIFSPIVLSPLVLHPLILVPGIFNPIILSPLLLSPFILSPQVFTPLILSPFVLNPLILTPMVGSPLILSPFVLSPIILSPQYLFAVVLSPYALSPLIESKLTVSEVVLSPSWLS